jgi:Tol biopolymer transport system component
MRTRILVACVAIGISTALLAQTQTPASPDVLLKAAMQKEQVDGDLPGALALYKDIVAKFPKDAAAPKALLQMAGIYGRQRNQSAAQAAYERILREYPASGEPATVARSRVNGAATSVFRQTQLEVGGRAAGMLGSGRVSPDGRFISFDGGSGSLAIWDVLNDRVTDVPRAADATPYADGSAQGSAWSSDGTQLAYAWRFRGGVQERELRIVDVKTGLHRVVLRTTADAPYIGPFAFSPAGDQILASLATGARGGGVGVANLVLVSTADGTTRSLVQFEGSEAGGAVFSPDGRYVAFDFQPDANSKARDIAIVNVATAERTVITEARAGNDTLLGWLPSGHLLFTSDRDGTSDAWRLLVTDGVPVGEPVLVKHDVGQLQPQGVTRDGRVFAWKWIAIRDVFIAEIDPATGRAIGPPASLARPQPAFWRSEPAWSPDGTQLAYVQSGPGLPQSIAIHTISTNEVRVYPVPVRNIDWPIWSADGRLFVFNAIREGDGSGAIFQLDLQSGRVEPFHDQLGAVVGFSPDNRFAYLNGARLGLRRWDSTDGSIATIGQGATGMTLSPDGQWLAYLTQPAGGVRSLVVRPVTGGEAHVLSDMRSRVYPRFTWTPDSRYVIFHDAEGLQRVSREGGAPSSLGIPDAGFVTEKSMNADGRRLAYAVSRDRTELWVWENVVPKEKQP